MNFWGPFMRSDFKNHLCCNFLISFSIDRRKRFEIYPQTCFLHILSKLSCPNSRGTNGVCPAKTLSSLLKSVMVKSVLIFSCLSGGGDPSLKDSWNCYTMRILVTHLLKGSVSHWWVIFGLSSIFLLPWGFSFDTLICCHKPLSSVESLSKPHFCTLILLESFL